MKVNTGVASPTRRTQAERTAATRALLIDSARKLFARTGFGAVSPEALDAATLYSACAADNRHAREEMELVCDRVVAGIAGRDVEALPAVGLKPPRRRP